MRVGKTANAPNFPLKLSQGAAVLGTAPYPGLSQCCPWQTDILFQDSPRHWRGLIIDCQLMEADNISISCKGCYRDILHLLWINNQALLSQAHKLPCSLRQIRLECSPCCFTQLLSGNKSGISWPDTENPTSSWYACLPCTCSFSGGSTAALCTVLCNPFASGALPLLHKQWRSGASKAHPLMGTHAQHGVSLH